jgi:predicted membrane-bound mannosyltransferase
MPEFWLAVPAILSMLLLGAVALAAVMRARPEDVPWVLAIYLSALAVPAGSHTAGRAEPKKNLNGHAHPAARAD